MATETKQFFKDVLFKVLPSVFVSIAALICTVKYNNWQREIKKIELANQFFKEIEAESDPTEQTLALKKVFITRVLNEPDPQLFALLDTAIKYNLSAKIMKAQELAKAATSSAERVAALNVLGATIDRAKTFSDKAISKISEGHQEQYEEYSKIKEAETINNAAIEDLNNGNIEEAERKLKKVKRTYADYPGIQAAILSIAQSKQEVASDPSSGHTEAEKLKAITVEPILQEREIVKEKILPQTTMQYQRPPSAAMKFRQIQ